MYKVGFILNGRKSAKSQIYRRLSEFKDAICNTEYILKETLRAGHASILAREFAENGYTHIIAVGGDGTLNEVVNGVLNSSFSPIVGLLPFGSANDFSRTLDCPRNLSEVFDCIENQSFEKIDIGRVNFIGDNQENKERFFINIADLGIGAEVVKRVNNSSRFWGASIIFYKSILRSFISYKNKSLSAKTDDWSWSGKINSFIIANGKYFGNGMCVAPSADPKDGIFEIVVIGDISIYDYLKQVNKIKKGIRINHPKLEYRQTSKIELKAAVPCGIEADGEFLGDTPCELTLLPKQLNYLVR